MPTYLENTANTYHTALTSLVGVLQVAHLVNVAKEQRSAGITPVPILFSKGWDYLEQENRYLRAKASGDWVRGKWLPFCKKRILLSEDTIKAYGKDMVDLLVYQEVRKINWKSGEIDVILDEYYQDSTNGNWQLAGEPVCGRTCERRRRIGADFFSFLVATETVARPADGSMFERPRQPARRRRGPRIQGAAGGMRGVRRGPVRKDTDDLAVPTKAEVDEWLGRVSAGCATIGEMCHAVIGVGLRSREACLFRAEDLPLNLPPDGEEAELKVKWGAKRPKRPQDPEKEGKLRRAVVDAKSLARLIRYRDEVRPAAVRAFQIRNPGKSLPKQLFLDPRTGNPISQDRLYRAWADARGAGAVGPGWSPHPGRHLYALRTALRALRDEAAAYGERAIDPRRILSALTIVVQPSLGHEDYDTTKRYLKWLRRAFRGGGLQAACNRFLGA